jgi:hypothetical protein
MSRCLNDPQCGLPSPSSPCDPSKLYFRRLVGHLTVVTELEELMRHETKSMREQHGRESLDHAVVTLDHAIDRTARSGELVLDAGQVGLEMLEIAVCLEVRVSLRQGEQLPQCTAEHGFGLRLGRGSLCRSGGIPCLHHQIECAALMAGIASDTLDEVGNKVMTLSQWPTKLGERRRRE